MRSFLLLFSSMSFPQPATDSHPSSYSSPLPPLAPKASHSSRIPHFPLRRKRLNKHKTQTQSPRIRYEAEKASHRRMIGLSQISENMTHPKSTHTHTWEKQETRKADVRHHHHPQRGMMLVQSLPTPSCFLYPFPSLPPPHALSQT